MEKGRPAIFSWLRSTSKASFLGREMTSYQMHKLATSTRALLYFLFAILTGGQVRYEVPRTSTRTSALRFLRVGR